MFFILSLDLITSAAEDIYKCLCSQVLTSLPSPGAIVMMCTLFLVILCLGVSSVAPTLDPTLDTEWQMWKMEYEKSYSLVSNLRTLQKNLRAHCNCCCNCPGKLEVTDFSHHHWEIMYSWSLWAQGSQIPLSSVYGEYMALVIEKSSPRPLIIINSKSTRSAHAGV